MTDGNMRQLALEKTSVSSYTGFLAFFGKTKKQRKDYVILCLEMRNFIQVVLR